jgi:uncharacterized membrane protein
LWQVILLSISPISELRGGIPLGIALEYHPVLVFIIAVAFNVLIYFPIRFMLDKIGNVVIKLPLVESARDRGRCMVSRYGLIGLGLLVAIPLPFTGVYTASLASWSLKYSYKESILPIAIGVVVAGLIVTLVSIGVVTWVKG